MEIANFVATIAAILVGGFIAYHLYFLQKRLSFNDKIRHATSLRDKVKERLYDIRYKDINSEVMLVNIKRYEKDYEGENTKNRHGYVELRAELKDVRYNGIEFFSEMPKQAYFSDDDLTLTESKKKAFTVFPVGLTPYEWIEYVDMDGDEYRYVPIFYTKFKGQDKFPFKSVSYYKKNDNDHYELVDIKP